MGQGQHHFISLYKVYVYIFNIYIYTYIGNCCPFCPFVPRRQNESKRNFRRD